MKNWKKFPSPMMSASFMVPRDSILSSFIESELDRMAEQRFQKRVKKCPVAVLNRLFVSVVNEKVQ